MDNVGALIHDGFTSAEEGECEGRKFGVVEDTVGNENGACDGGLDGLEELARLPCLLPS